MTEKLYYTDSHLSEFNATVLECTENSRGQYETVLDRTAFFPEGGGQYGDRGFIGDVEITDTRISNGKAVHISSAPTEEGKEYLCKVDFKDRFRKMQHHSGEHIVSGLFHNLYGYNNIGFHLGQDNVTIDIDHFLDEESIRKVESEANKAIYQNIPVRAYYPSKEEAERLSYRSKTEIENDLRIVEIKGYDVCACCAPHVSFTGEIGIIRLASYMKYKNGTRITLICGEDALRDYVFKNGVLDEVGKTLSSPPEKISDALNQLAAEKEKLKRELESANKTIADYLTNSVKNEKYPCVFCNLDRNSMIYGADNAAKNSEIAFFFSGNDEDGYIFVISSFKQNLKELSKRMSQSLDFKGGGNKERLSGTVFSPKADLIVFIKQLKEESK